MNSHFLNMFTQAIKIWCIQIASCPIFLLINWYNKSSNTSKRTNWRKNRAFRMTIHLSNKWDVSKMRCSWSSETPSISKIISSNQKLKTIAMSSLTFSRLFRIILYSQTSLLNSKTSLKIPSTQWYWSSCKVRSNLKMHLQRTIQKLISRLCLLLTSNLPNCLISTSKRIN